MSRIRVGEYCARKNDVTVKLSQEYIQGERDSIVKMRIT